MRRKTAIFSRLNPSHILIMTDDLEFTPDPPAPSPEAQHRAVRVGRIADDLRLAAKDDTAYYTSCALYSLQEAACLSNSPQITVDEANVLFLALQDAATAIFAQFPNPKDCIFARGAFWSTVSMMQYWAATEERRLSMRPDSRQNMIDRVRWLRNALHNVSLKNQIRERAAKRGELALHDLMAIAYAETPLDAGEF